MRTQGRVRPPAAELAGLDDARHDAREWLMTVAAPLWSTVGLSANGMFAERIGIDGKEVALNRRLRVQARQIYSFCAIGQLGWNGPWREIVGGAVDIMISRGRRGDGLFGHLFNHDGDLIKDSLDLYDHAFALFALAHAAKALDRPDLLDIAEQVQAKLDETWWRPEGGYWEGELTPCPPYRQNPHMHMYEAAMANDRAGGGPQWKGRYRKVGNLFASHFLDAESGAVTEYFDVNWRRLADASGEIVEPGHCLEWAWLFEVTDEDGQGVAIAERLTAFARRHGICPRRGVAINEVRRDGSIVDDGARLWPQTERLKAAMVRYKRTGHVSEVEEVVAAYRGLKLYLDTPVPGLWWDRLNADGTFVEEAAPASSFYHIVCALNELLA